VRHNTLCGIKIKLHLRPVRLETAENRLIWPEKQKDEKSALKIQLTDVHFPDTEQDA
jgi:hypothetical protein